MTMFSNRPAGWLLLCLTVLVFASCRTGKPVAAKEAVHSESFFTSCYPIGSISAPKCKWEITDGDKSYRMSGSLYIRSDSICYFRAVMLVEIFRGAIEKDSFVILNRLERTCYRGSNQYLSRITGYPVNPVSLQLLFTADACEPLYRELGFTAVARRQEVMLTGNNARIEIRMDENRRIRSVSAYSSATDIRYDGFQDFHQFALPSSMHIAFSLNRRPVRIAVEFQEFFFDRPQPVNMKIPADYKMIYLK
jgi:hypothetical protein